MREHNKKQRDEGVEKNFKKMRYPCMGCRLKNGDDEDDRDHWKSLREFGVHTRDDFVFKLLPHGAWTRCQACRAEMKQKHLGEQGHLGGKLGGNTNNPLTREERAEAGKLGGKLGGDTNNPLTKEERAEAGKLGGKLGGKTNNAVIKKRSFDAMQACETCEQCGRLLSRAFYWPEQWRHRTENKTKMKCKECSPTRPKGRPGGYVQLNEQRSREAAAKPLTCQVCERTLPRTQFRAYKNGKFDLRKPQTCEQCRADGKLPTRGWKKRRLE